MWVSELFVVLRTSRAAAPTSMMIGSRAIWRKMKNGDRSGAWH